MPDVDIVFEKNEKEPFEDKIKQEKQEIIEDNKAEAEAQPEAEAPEGSLATTIAMLWNKIATDKGYEAVNDKEVEYLKQHSSRLEQKYANKIEVIKYPEIEFLLANLMVFAPKIYKKASNKPLTKA
jgi:hypothetical protein